MSTTLEKDEDLRDEFAGIAMGAMHSDVSFVKAAMAAIESDDPSLIHKKIAKSAYDLAEAMMEERSRRLSGGAA